MSTTQDTLTYSNPRMHDEIGNWPMGHNLRGTAIFDIERKPGKGERGMRVTRRDDTHTLSKPKVMTFARKARIVDGSDGKTYIAELSVYGFVTIMQSNMQYQQEVIHASDERHAAVMALFDDQSAQAALLEALSAFVATADDYNGLPFDVEGTKAIKRNAIQARAAIARARGEG